MSVFNKWCYQSFTEFMNSVAENYMEFYINQDSDFYFRDNLKKFIDGILIKFSTDFNNLELTSVGPFTEEETEIMRGKYNIIVNRDYLLEKYGYKNLHNAFQKLERKFSRYVGDMIKNNIFSIKYPGQHSIIMLKDYLGDLIFSRLKTKLHEKGIETMEQLCALSKDEVACFWSRYNTTSQLFIEVVHSLGYYFRDEKCMGLSDPSVTTKKL